MHTHARGDGQRKSFRCTFFASKFHICRKSTYLCISIIGCVGVARGSANPHTTSWSFGARPCGEGVVLMAVVFGRGCTKIYGFYVFRKWEHVVCFLSLEAPQTPKFSMIDAREALWQCFTCSGRSKGKAFVSHAFDAMFVFWTIYGWFVIRSMNGKLNFRRLHRSRERVFKVLAIIQICYSCPIDDTRSILCKTPTALCVKSLIRGVKCAHIIHIC